MILKEKMNVAMNIKNENFGSDIIFSYPNQTLALTLTGNNCDLKCSHCNGHYLKNMIDINVLDEKKRDITSFLLSGGCKFDGSVPLLNYLDKIKEFKSKGYKLNAHLGLMNKEDIDKICEYIDVVSFDLVLDDNVIKDVYKADKKKQDYIDTYRILKDKVDVIPHICIGLHKGYINYEYEVLEFLEKEKPKGITFIVLIPTKGTDYQDINPPDMDKVLDVICEARIKFQDIPINLGCMRPRGNYRSILDEKALMCGINNIVLPSRACIKKAKELNLNIINHKECCVL